MDPSDRRARIAAYQEDHARYETMAATRAPEGFIGLRLDGRGFSHLTSSYVKPFDPVIESAMEAGVEALLTEVSDAVCGYVQSDEITLVLRRESDWFDRRVEKLVSVSASVVSFAVSQALGTRALFDARTLALPGTEDVMAMLAERMIDAEKNCLTSLCYWELRRRGASARHAARRLEPLRGPDRRALLAELGIDWETVPLERRRGRLAHWITLELEGRDPRTDTPTRYTRARIRWDRALADFTHAPTLACLSRAQAARVG